MTEKLMAGGCQCGRIRYEAVIRDDKAYLCHCTYCRRATGNVSVAFKNVPQADVRWATREPDWYQSSPIARRPFCPQCGTPLGFTYLDGTNIDLTVGSFDDPGFFRPTSNFAIDTKLAAWEDTSHLPGMRADEHQPLTDRWVAATGRLPD
ncbi:glutathione-dependent formaldehyde-activating protein [Sphingomonas sp. MM-1]|uniref:GFA family protein n=1 Tax=Sphingomonas sp. MM-1 TaxID=745310 RepID=UPI0002C04DE9|nr:GFA family protein [Sphingomonas sp. MM-1]AGH47912.1 glutathione-dependent formaldehyde-activating protein [Sphingomonas sp. MM-1]